MLQNNTVRVESDLEGRIENENTDPFNFQFSHLSNYKDKEFAFLRPSAPVAEIHPPTPFRPRKGKIQNRPKEPFFFSYFDPVREID